MNLSATRVFGRPNPKFYTVGISKEDNDFIEQFAEQRRISRKAAIGNLISLAKDKLNIEKNDRNKPQ